MIFASIKDGIFTSYPSILAKIQKLDKQNEAEVEVSERKNGDNSPVISLANGVSSKLRELLEKLEQNIQRFKAPLSMDNLVTVQSSANSNVYYSQENCRAVFDEEYGLSSGVGVVDLMFDD